MEPQNTKYSPSDLMKEQQSGRHYISWFQTKLQSHGNKTLQYQQKDRHTARKQNRAPRNKATRTHSQLIFNKGAKNTMGKG